jgi:hypothetical protein
MRNLWLVRQRKFWQTKTKADALAKIETIEHSLAS